MVKLEITIKEIDSLDYKDITAIGTEVSNILKKRLKVDEKLQIESNKEELKEQLEKLLKSL